MVAVIASLLLIAVGVLAIKYGIAFIVAGIATIGGFLGSRRKG